MLATSILCVLATALSASSSRSTPITSVKEARQVLSEGNGAGRTFDFTGTIVHEQSPLIGTFHVLGGGQIVELHRFPHSSSPPIVAGDIVRVRGTIIRPQNMLPQAHAAELTRIGHEHPPTPRPVTAKDIFSGRCDSAYVCAEGIVLDAHHDDIDPHFSFLILNCDGAVLYATLAERLPLEDLHALTGARVSVSGMCNRAPDLRRHQNYEIDMNTHDDIRVIAYPPWWTPARLLALIGLLVALLVAIAVWNVMLNRRSERRGRELADERLAHVTSELKVMERTRLAVELHDTLAQNLTGISLEVQAARTRLRTDPERADGKLALAGKSLEACRRELRNCLRDLRSDALEQPCMDTAIRMTLEPHVENAKVAVRFNVPRGRLSDNAAHAILRIIRELVLNALRHGKAESVRVAGSIEGNRLLFSVRDDGCGFDPSSAPGARQGHFGLVGIRERVNALAGELNIDSQPGQGVRVLSPKSVYCDDDGAFYGRRSLDLVVSELPLSECVKFWGRAAGRLDTREIIDVLSVTGGIPRYLEELATAATANENIRNVDLLVQTRRTAYLVEVKRRREIGREVIREMEAKVALVPTRKGVSLRTALVYEGDLAPIVEADGYFDAIIPFRRLLGL